MNWRNLGGLYAIQGVNLVLPLITVPILARALGADGFGVLSWIFATGFLIVLLTDCGINSVAVSLIARRAQRSLSVTSIFSATQYLRFIVAGLASAVLLILAWFIPAWHAHFKLFCIALANVAGTLLFPAYFFLARERSVNTAILQLIGRGLCVILIATLVRSKSDLTLALLLQSAASLTSGILLHAFGANFGLPRYVRVSSKQIKSLVRMARPLWWSEFQTQAMASVPTMLLGMTASSAVTGAYAVSDKIVRAAAALLLPISQALLPHFSSTKMQLQSNASHHTRRWLAHIALLALIVCLVVYFLGDMAFQIIAGRRFVESAASMSLVSALAAWLFCHVLVRSVEQLIYIAGMRLPYYWKLVRFVLPIQWVLLLVLTPLSGSIGTVVALIAYETILLCVLLFGARKQGWV
jgi:polysaccharide transporter, PST family